MAKETKTNAMRMLERQKVPYQAFTYECDDFIDGIHCADMIQVPHEQSFKTLVMEGKSGGYYVFVVPIEAEVDRKSAARAVGEKAVDMIHVKDINKITGYIRGGCSPLGMKKQFRTFIEMDCLNQDKIYFSAGKIGMQIQMDPKTLMDLIHVQAGDITKE